MLGHRIQTKCFEKEDVLKAAGRSGRGEVKESIQFSEMDSTDDIKESNFGGVRGSNAKLR